MTTSKRLAVVTAVVTTTSLALMSAGTASADAKHGDTLTLQCDALGVLEVLVFSNGFWSPALVAGSNQVLVPHEIHAEGTFTPTQGEKQSFSDNGVKPAPRSGRTDHCVFHDEGSDQSGTFEIDGEVRVSYTPGH